MLGYRRRAGASARPAAKDTGFTLVEVMVSIAVIGVVMTALTTFFVSTSSVLNYQRTKQVAVRIAHDGVELVRSLEGPYINAGRTEEAVLRQFAQAPARLRTLLTTTMVPTWRQAPPPTGGTSRPALPVEAEPLVFDGMDYQRHFYLGECWQPKPGAGGSSSTTDATCGLRTGAVPEVDLLPFFRVIVAVTWSDPRQCAAGCLYWTSTLVSGSEVDPVFNPNATGQRPSIVAPGNRSSTVNVAVDPVQLVATSDATPLTWRPEGLPPGLSMDAAGKITGTPTQPGTYVVRAIASDPNAENHASFTWVVNPAPTMTPPGNQSSAVGQSVMFTVAVTGGTPPLTWTATGLPADLSIDPQTGVISGTPMTRRSPTAVTVTVTDEDRVTNSLTFTWGVLGIVTPTANPITVDVGDDSSVYSPVASGGTGAYSWTADNLPTGVTMAPDGRLSGAFAAGTRFLTTLRVSDGMATHAVVVPVTVNTSGLRVGPATTTGDRSNPVGVRITTPATRAGGQGSHSWTATGLPTGLDISDVGVISGVPTVKGAYTTKLVVTDATNATATYMFLWTIT